MTHLNKYQYHIRKGEYPAYKWYVVSPYEYTNTEKARAAAMKYALNMGEDPSKLSFQIKKEGWLNAESNRNNSKV